MVGGPARAGGADSSLCGTFQAGGRPIRSLTSLNNIHYSVSVNDFVVLGFVFVFGFFFFLNLNLLFFFFIYY